MSKKIAAGILRSRKYRGLHPPFAERIAADALRKFGPETAEVEARKTLHQVWGAFYGIRPDFRKLEKRFSSDLEKVGEAQALTRVLKLHSSTRERAPYLEEFYKRIFEITGRPGSVREEGCGLNPLTAPWMNLAPGASYLGRDIDLAEIGFLKGVIRELEWKKIRVAPGDALADTGPRADIAFLLKLLPSLEQQSPGSSEVILKKIPARWLVISFPSGSLSGGKRGMASFHEKNFAGLAEKMRLKAKLIRFPSETVFVIRKG